MNPSKRLRAGRSTASDASVTAAASAPRKAEMNGSIDRCPRCAHSFHCGFADETPCACTTVHLDDALLVDLRRRFRGCLCLRCLSELAATCGAGLPQSRSSVAVRTMQSSARTGPLPEE